MFYDELKKEIEELINDCKYDQALLVIQEELRMPYVPLEFEQYLQQAKVKIQELNQTQKATKATSLTPDEIKKKLLSQDVIDQALAMEAIKNINVRLILPEVQTFLLNPKVNQETKTLMLLILQDQQIITEVKVEKKGQVSTVVPSELKSDVLFETLQAIIQIIDQVIEGKNPTWTKNAQNAALIFLMKIFLEKENYSFEDIAAAMIKKSSAELGINLSWEELKAKLNFNLSVVEAILLIAKNLEETEVGKEVS